MIIRKNYNEFHFNESSPSVSPYSVIYNYNVRNDNYYNWNIFVFKMLKLIVQLTKDPNMKGLIYIYDGPNFRSGQHNANTVTTFISNSFQVSILYQGHYSNVELKFNSYFFKKTVRNYNNYFINDTFEMKSRHLKCTNQSIVICAFNFYVPKNSYINITVLYLNYKGSNVEIWRIVYL